MRDVFLDTYWLPLRVVAGLKWHLLWLAVLPPALLMAKADGYFPLNVTGALLFAIRFGF